MCGTTDRFENADRMAQEQPSEIDDVRSGSFCDLVIRPINHSMTGSPRNQMREH